MVKRALLHKFFPLSLFTFHSFHIILDKDRLSPQDYDTVSFPFVNLGWDINEEINPIMYTKNEWQQYDFTPFYENVNHDGIAI